MKKKFRVISCIFVLCMFLLTGCTNDAEEAASEIQIEDVQLENGLEIEALPVLEITAIPQFQVYTPVYSIRRSGTNMLVQAYNLDNVAGKKLSVNAQTDFSMELLDESRGLDYYNIIVVPEETLAQNEILDCARSGEIFWNENKFEILEETPEYVLLYGEKTYGDDTRAWYLSEVDGTLIAIERSGWGFVFDREDTAAREEIVNMCSTLINEHLKIYDNLTEEEIKTLLPSEIAVRGSDFRIPAEEIIGWYCYEIQWRGKDNDGNPLIFTLYNVMAKDEDSGTQKHTALKAKYSDNEDNPDAVMSGMLGLPAVPDGNGGYLVKVGKNHICTLTTEKAN